MRVLFAGKRGWREQQFFTTEWVMYTHPLQKSWGIPREPGPAQGKTLTCHYPYNPFFSVWHDYSDDTVLWGPWRDSMNKIMQGQLEWSFLLNSTDRYKGNSDFTITQCVAHHSLPSVYSVLSPGRSKLHGKPSSVLQTVCMHMCAEYGRSSNVDERNLPYSHSQAREYSHISWEHVLVLYFALVKGFLNNVI